MEKCKDCVWLIQVNKHPWNKNDGRGICSEKMGYACTVQLDEQKRDNIIFFDDDFGSCELHTHKDKYRLKISTIEI